MSVRTQPGHTEFARISLSSLARMRVSASGHEQLLGAELAGVLLCARAEAR